MNEKIEKLVQGVLEMAAKPDATPQAVHMLGLEAKQALWDEFDNLQLAVNILDGVVPYKAGGLRWTMGWVNPSAGPDTSPNISSPTTSVTATTTTRAPDEAVRPTQAMLQKQRTARVLYLAGMAVDSGRTTITTAEIAATLQKDGDTTVSGSLRTGVGNILARTGTWKRVGEGEYQYHERGVM